MSRQDEIAEVACFTAFDQILKDLRRFRGIGSGLIQEAIANIENEFADSALTADVIAQRLKAKRTTFLAEFHRETGVRCDAYLRDVRLCRAAEALLAADGQ